MLLLVTMQWLQVWLHAWRQQCLSRSARLLVPQLMMMLLAALHAISNWHSHMAAVDCCYCCCSK